MKSLSAVNFVEPYKLSGDDALSVLSATTFLILFFIQTFIKFCEPIIFVCTTSKGLYSANSTCLSAAV